MIQALPPFVALWEWNKAILFGFGVVNAKSIWYLPSADHSPLVQMVVGKILNIIRKLKIKIICLLLNVKFFR